MRLIKDAVVPQGESRADAALAGFEALGDHARFLDQGWSAEEVFWSRYFWIRAYATAVQAAGRPDAGLEQFVFKVLESPLPACSPDWSQLETIDQLAQSEAQRLVVAK